MELKHLNNHKSAAKRDCEQLEKELAELHDKINAARKKQPHQGKKKKPEDAKALQDKYIDEAESSSKPLRGSIVEPPRAGCCIIV